MRICTSHSQQNSYMALLPSYGSDPTQLAYGRSVYYCLVVFLRLHHARYMSIPPPRILSDSINDLYENANLLFGMEHICVVHESLQCFLCGKQSQPCALLRRYANQLAIDQPSGFPCGNLHAQPTISHGFCKTFALMFP